MSNVINLNNTAVPNLSSTTALASLVEITSPFSACIALENTTHEATSLVNLESVPENAYALVAKDERNNNQLVIVSVLPLPVPSSVAQSKAKAVEKHIDLTAHESVTLSCGLSSITLKRNGDIKIKGKNVLSQSSNQQKIKGASVSIN